MTIASKGDALRAIQKWQKLVAKRENDKSAETFNSLRYALFIMQRDLASEMVLDVDAIKPLLRAIIDMVISQHEHTRAIGKRLLKVVPPAWKEFADAE